MSGGPVAEVNTSGFIHPGFGPQGRSVMRVGASAGGFVNLGITKWFAVQCDALLHYKTSEFRWTDHRGVCRFWGEEISLLAMFRCEVGSDGFLYAGIGPYSIFGLSGTFREGGQVLDVYAKDERTGLPPLYDAEHGFGLRIGYEVARVQVNVSYKVAVSNLLDENTAPGVSMYPHTASIGLAYRFGAL